MCHAIWLNSQQMNAAEDVIYRNVKETLKFSGLGKSLVRSAIRAKTPLSAGKPRGASFTAAGECRSLRESNFALKQYQSSAR